MQMEGRPYIDQPLTPFPLPPVVCAIPIIMLMKTIAVTFYFILVVKVIIKKIEINILETKHKLNCRDSSDRHNLITFTLYLAKQSSIAVISSQPVVATFPVSF